MIHAIAEGRGQIAEVRTFAFGKIADLECLYLCNLTSAL